MKFGETLYQRSVPKWAAYNLSYNELKHLIKTRTSTGLAVPVAIPGQSNNKWAALENDLYAILQEQYNNIALFLRSKHGEIERRLCYLEKQVRSTKRALDHRATRSQLLARKYHRLVQECDSLGEDIQNLSRFASTQKTAFRKILKKYKKWTGSTALQTRIETELFADGQLQLDLTNQMQRLSDQMVILTGPSEPPTPNSRSPVDEDDGHLGSNKSAESPVSRINDATRLGQLNFDAAFASTTFGKAAGTAAYWIHPDNFEEAQVLLMRYMHNLFPLDTTSRSASIDGSHTPSTPVKRDGVPQHTVFCDNLQRFAQDNSTHCPSKIALCGRWSLSSDSVVTMADLAPRALGHSTVGVKRKELGQVLTREAKTAKPSSGMEQLQDFLDQHRDIKPLASVHSIRARYAGSTNSAEVGTWAVLDRDLVFSTFSKQSMSTDLPSLDTGGAFPHAVLEIRWEFGRRPEVVRAFDATHLAEKVEGFSLESAAICKQHETIPRPHWIDLLAKDIRKVPVVRLSGSFRRHDSSAGATSGPSSIEDSVFSLPGVHSTAGSETSPTASCHGVASGQNVSAFGADNGPPRKKKKARIRADSPPPPQARYYSEYDDPESELNQEDTYVIYVDPDEKLPGSEMFSKMYSSLYSGFGNGSSRIASWLSLKPHSADLKDGSAHERSPLLSGRKFKGNHDFEDDSSDSDSSSSPIAYKPAANNRNRRKHDQHLTRRQRGVEKTMQRICAGLLGLGYLLLLMSGVLLTTGRKRKELEVDVGAILGVIAAWICGFGSLALAFMRKAPLGSVEWGLLCVSVIGIAVFGAGLMVMIFARVS